MIKSYLSEAINLVANNPDMDKVNLISEYSKITNSSEDVAVYFIDEAIKQRRRNYTYDQTFPDEELEYEK